MKLIASNHYRRVNLNQSIVILGGGTAGWMTAVLFAHRWPSANIHLIESSDIPTVGVGEGSTPYLKNLFDQLNISEDEWMAQCNATYKNGITFKNWSTQPGCGSYFHPFLSQYDAEVTPVFAHHSRLRCHGYPVQAHPDHYFLTKQLTDEYKSALQIDSDNSVVTLYAYHFDSAKLGIFLKNKSIELGVKHSYGTIKSVQQKDNGDIAQLTTNSGEILTGDLFVDCSGFNALLIDKTLKTPFVKFDKNLFNDSAIAIPSAKVENYKPETKSTALSCGWAWQIPLTNRVGNGYVYSSKYQTPESAEAELRKLIGVTDQEQPAKHIKMRVGRVEKHWNKNCLAVGLSQGFIEPLEATALNFVQDTINSFIQAYEQGEKNRQTFNDKMNYAFERIRDYIVLHYWSNSRNDSQYWQDCKQVPISESLHKLLGVWFSGGDLTAELKAQQIEQYYPSASWHALLAGCGVFPPLDPAKKEDFSQELTSIITRRQQLCTLFKKLS